MTDKDIIKALECCSSGDYKSCKKCPLFENCNTPIYQAEIIMKNTLDLINRQQETIETLRNCVKQHHIIRKDDKSPLSLLTSEIKAEAIKEFAERLHNLIHFDWQKIHQQIDNLVKEMVGEE